MWTNVHKCDEHPTQEQILQYMENPGEECPACKSAEIARDNPEYEGGSLSVHLLCLSCNLAWVEWYDLTGVTVDYRYVEKQEGANG